MTKISVIAKDMTQQRQAERQIIALNEGLEQMVAERTNALENAYTDLESFSYTVTHEFKTPIREIDTYMSIIEEDNESRLLPESLDDIASVRKICKETLDMVQKMMVYSRAGYMVLNIEKIDMNKLVDECFNEIAMSCDLESKLTKYNLAPLDADVFLMRVAITNILSNSFKFSRNKGSVNITVGCMVSKNERTYYFTDNGVGFKSDKQDELFELYHRAHNSGDYEGSGIGLAIVKKIVIRSGGSVAIFSKVNIGCSVIMSFKATPHN